MHLKIFYQIILITSVIFSQDPEVLLNQRELKLESGDITEFTPKDVCNHYAIAPNTKEARRIQKNMLRMKEDQFLVQGSKYGTYKIAPRLTTDAISAAAQEDRDRNKIAVENEKKKRGIDFEADKIS